MDIILETSIRREIYFSFFRKSKKACHISFLCPTLKEGCLIQSSNFQILCRLKHSEDLRLLQVGKWVEGRAFLWRPSDKAFHLDFNQSPSHLCTGILHEISCGAKEGNSADGVFTPPITECTIKLTHPWGGHNLRKEINTYATIS